MNFTTTFNLEQIQIENQINPVAKENFLEAVGSF